MIKGENVTLRPVEESDLELLARWRNDTYNRRFFFSPFLISQGGQNRWHEALQADRTRMLLMIDDPLGKPIGMIGMDNIDWRNQVCEGGQILLDPEERGLGYAEEATQLLIRYTFEELNLHRVYCYCYDFNPVIEWMKLFGFEQEGVLRRAAFTQGEFHDVVVMGLLREEWQYDGPVES